MPIDDNTTFEVSSKGNIESDAIDRCLERLNRVGGHCREPITHVELRLSDDRAHRAQMHARAEATLLVKHGPVRAHSQAKTIGEAVDLMLERLRRRVDRHESKLHRIGTKRHDGVASDGAWHHGDVVAAPRHAAPVSDEPATVVRRKTFACAPMSVEEAIFDMDILDHNFYLFQELGGQVCVVSAGEHGIRLLAPQAAEIDLPDQITCESAAGPLVLSLPEAQRLIDTTGEPFVFFKTGPDAPSQVLYRRLDANFGIIELDPVVPSNARDPQPQPG